MANYDHCLRPVFTERIVQLLQRSRSINLIGTEGTGRERLLEDIRKCDLPNAKIILVNLKSYRESYDGLMREVWSQLDKEGKKPTNLSELIERCEDKTGQIFLLLHNFDALLNNPQVAPKYDTIFYDALNYCKNRPNIALLCVTQKPHDQSLVYVNGEQHRNSWLDLEQKFIPQLSREEIMKEFDRRLDPSLIRKDGALSFMLDAIQPHEAPYQFLIYLTDKIANNEDQSLPVQEKLEKWDKAFTQSKSRLSPAHIDKVQEKIVLWRKILGVEPGKVQSRWKLLLRILIGLLGLLGVLRIVKPDVAKSIIDLLTNWMP